MSLSEMLFESVRLVVDVYIFKYIYIYIFACINMYDQWWEKEAMSNLAVFQKGVCSICT